MRRGNDEIVGRVGHASAARWLPPSPPDALGTRAADESAAHAVAAAYLCAEALYKTGMPARRPDAVPWAHVLADLLTKLSPS